MVNFRGCKGELLELALSDHTAQLLICPVKAKCTYKYWFIKRRDYSQENIEKFKECISSLSFHDVLQMMTPMMHLTISMTFLNYFIIYVSHSLILKLTLEDV